MRRYAARPSAEGRPRSLLRSFPADAFADRILNIRYFLRQECSRKDIGKTLIFDASSLRGRQQNGCWPPSKPSRIQRPTVSHHRRGSYGRCPYDPIALPRFNSRTRLPRSHIRRSDFTMRLVGRSTWRHRNRLQGPGRLLKGGNWRHLRCVHVAALTVASLFPP